jgi:hypothetical protein
MAVSGAGKPCTQQRQRRAGTALAAPCGNGGTDMQPMCIVLADQGPACLPKSCEPAARLFPPAA